MPFPFGLPTFRTLNLQSISGWATTVAGHGTYHQLILCTVLTTLLLCRSALQDTVADLRAQLQEQAGQLDSTAALEGALTEQHQEMEQLHSQLLEQQQANDGLQREATLAHIQLQESREAFRVRIQHCMLEVCPATPLNVKLIPSTCIVTFSASPQSAHAA